MRTDINDTEKNKIATELLLKQSKDIAQLKGQAKVEAYVDRV